MEGTRWYKGSRMAAESSNPTAVSSVPFCATDGNVATGQQISPIPPPFS